MKRFTLHIDGMSCGHCLKAVNAALDAMPGVTLVSVRMGRAEVEVPEGGPTSDLLVSAVEEAGYSVTMVDPPA